MAPLVKELESRAEIQSICCITAQHRQMLDDVLQLFAIQPDYDLDIMEARQSLYTITSKCLLGMEEVFSREKPDLVLVHGDTSTTFSGALAAFYQKIAVGHVEAGLRTWDKYSPFPEEMNRTLVGDLAEFHFCPTQANRENLLREGLREGIFVTGNTVIACVKNGIWSRRLKANLKVNAAASIIAGLAAGLIFFLTSYHNYHSLTGSIAVFVFIMFFTAVICLATLSFVTGIYKRRRRLLDSNDDSDEE